MTGQVLDGPVAAWGDTDGGGVTHGGGGVTVTPRSERLQSPWAERAPPGAAHPAAGRCLQSPAKTARVRLVAGKPVVGPVTPSASSRRLKSPKSGPHRRRKTSPLQRLMSPTRASALKETEGMRSMFSPEREREREREREHRRPAWGAGNTNSAALTALPPPTSSSRTERLISPGTVGDEGVPMYLFARGGVALKL